MRDDPSIPCWSPWKRTTTRGFLPKPPNGRTGRPGPRRPKAAIFRQRVLKPAQVAEQAESGKDALLITLRETGKVDFSRMEQLLRRPADSIQKELQEQGLIFLNPANEEWEIRDKYLTGNVGPSSIWQRRPRKRMRASLPTWKPCPPPCRRTSRP